MQSNCGEWEMRVYELPEYKFVYSYVKDGLPEEDFADPDGIYEPCLGLAQVVDGMIKIVQNGQYGFCDRYGNAAVPCVYDYAGQFEAGLCIVGIAGKYGIVDCFGNVVVPLVYPSLVRTYNEANGDRLFALPGKYLIDAPRAVEESGIPRYPYTREEPRCLLEFDTVSDYRTEVFWKNSDKLLAGYGGRFGVIDSKGGICAPLVYDRIQRNGIAIRDGRWAVLDADGREVLPPVYDRIRKVHSSKAIAGDYLGDFILAGEKGGPDHVFTKNGLLLCAMPDGRCSGRDVLARILESCLAEWLDENHCLIRAEGKYGVIQTGGHNKFEQAGQIRSGFAEILPFVWDDPEACILEYVKMLARGSEEDPYPQPVRTFASCATGHFTLLAGPFVRTPRGVQNMESKEIVLSPEYHSVLHSQGINSESYHGVTACKDGRWHFVELMRR